MRLLKSLMFGTLLSILFFFSISFITVLFEVNIPFNRPDAFGMSIGWPLTYYHEFNAGNSAPNSGWYMQNLLFDMALTWAIVTAIYTLIKRHGRH